MYFVACQKIVKPKSKLSTAAQVPFTRQLSIPVSGANVYQGQLAQNKTDRVNGDVGLNSTSSVSLIPAASDALTSQVKLNHFLARELASFNLFIVYVSDMYFSKSFYSVFCVLLI